MPQEWKKRVPKRTADIELWEENPVGNRAAWRRELLQFWAIFFTRGRRLAPPQDLRDLVAARGKDPATSQVAATLTGRVKADTEGAYVHHKVEDELKSWFEDSVVVPGERSKAGGYPSAGIGVPNYLGLLYLNRSVVRERYWAWFWYYALETDLDAARALGLTETAGARLDAYLSLGLTGDWRGADAEGDVNLGDIAETSPETYVVAKGLLRPAPEGGPAARKALADALNSAGAGPREGSPKAGSAPFMKSFLCPGSVILMRRSLFLLLEQQEQTDHAALSEVIEAALASHAALYFIRGMRVLNAISEDRKLPDDCAACWARFQPDVQPVPDGGREAREERWRADGYRAQATADDAAWIDETCKADDRLFVSLAGPDKSAAKDLARMGVERLRRQLAAYTVNRISLSIAHGIARTVAQDLGEAAPTLDKVFMTLDEWATTNKGLVASAWRRRIDDGDDSGIRHDEAIADAEFRASLDDRLAAASGDPVALEHLAREIVAEAVLSSRTFTRYRELLHSLLGGGSLPSNQDPKGMMASGGNQATRFYLTLHDSALEMMVAVAVLEASASRTDLTFDGFVKFLETRFHLSVEQGPSGEVAQPGLIAAAASQSRQALRERLSSMGMLEEYSDSSQWNRVTWVRQR